jgi:murein DD-endopeptidase MepM/ murein hydrolase activator NlpD
VNTPGFKVPSHGTDFLGQTYAYDFTQIDWLQKGYKFYKTPILRSLLLGAKLEDTYCWSKSIHSPFDGEVVEARDGVIERNPVHIIRDLFIVIKNGLLFRGEDNSDLSSLLGNFLIIKKSEGVYCMMAHAKTDSIQVVAGQKVKEGEVVAQVGHSGNSTAPHLHFQLMDRPDLLQAEGLPCCFKNYQLFENGAWDSVLNGVPGKRVRIRYD